MTDLYILDFLSGLFIILFIGLGIILLGLIRAIAQRRTFLEKLRAMQHSMRDLLSGMHALRVNLRQNQILQREPFLSRVKTLDIELTWLESEFNTFRDEYIKVQEKIDQWEKLNRFNYVYTLFPLSDYNRLIPAMDQFSSKIVILNEYLEKALLHTQEIAELGWEVALKLREILEKLNDSSRVLQTLCSKNVHGSSIEEAKLLIEAISQKTSALPDELLTGSKEEIIDETEYGAICSAYEIYEEIFPKINNLHQQLYQWWNDYQQATRTIDSAQSTLANTFALIRESREKIDLENVHDNLKTIQSIGDILKDTLTRVEIESLPDMIQEAWRIYRLAEETSETVKMARRNQSILEPLLEQIEVGISQLDEKINNLAKHATFPIAWDKSGRQFFSIKEHHKEIQVVDGLRSPDEIQNHLAIALSLYKEINELTSQIKQVLSTHETLVKTSQTDEINQGLYWCQEAKRIVESAKAYDSANFPKNLSIQSLASELESIQESHQTLINSLFSNPIVESSLETKLEEMRDLFDSYAVIHEQVGEVKGYITVLREDINQTRQTHQKILPFLNQMELIARSNPLLLQQGAEKEIERLRNHLDTCTAKVNDLSVGTVQNKQMAVTTLDRRVEKTCYKWIQIIERHIDLKSSDLREKLKKLSSIANLDDAAVIQARELLSKTGGWEQEAKTTDGKTSSYENPVLKLKARNDLWQKLLATSSEISETIFNPINEAYMAVETQKELAMKQLLLAAEHIPEKRIWPPTSILLPELSASLSTIDAVWNKNISQPMRAIWWVKRFGEIWIKYQEFTHSVILAIETCKKEQQAIIELEQQLDHIDQKWSILEQQMADNHNAAIRIRALKKNIEQQYKQIRRKWQFGSSVSTTGTTYDEIKNTLAELVERFQNARIIVSDENGENMVVNVFGQHIINTDDSFSEDII